MLINNISLPLEIRARISNNLAKYRKDSSHTVSENLYITGNAFVMIQAKLEQTW